MPVRSVNTQASLRRAEAVSQLLELIPEFSKNEDLLSGIAFDCDGSGQCTVVIIINTIIIIIIIIIIIK
jgi:hypothetical protein